MINVSLEVVKIKRSFCVVAGVAILAKFPTEEKAKDSLSKHYGSYKFWAESAGVSVMNTQPVIIKV